MTSETISEDGAMSERDELCAVISEAVGGWNAATRTITHVADVLLAAGYRKAVAPHMLAALRPYTIEDQRKHGETW